MEQYLTFIVDNIEYSILINNISEVIEYIVPTTLPKSADYVLGIISHRGTIVPLINMSKILKKDNAITKEFTGDNRVIIVERESGLVGLAVDTTDNVIELEDSQIDRSMYEHGKFKSGYVTGIGKIDEHKVVLILDLNRILD